MPSSGTLYEVLDPKFRKSATEWLSGNPVPLKRNLKSKVKRSKEALQKFVDITGMKGKHKI